MNIEIINSGDIVAWLELVQEVEPLFGPMLGMAGFQEHRTGGTESCRTADGDTKTTARVGAKKIGRVNTIYLLMATAFYE